MKKLGVCVVALVILGTAAPSLLAQQRQRGQRGAGFGGAGRDVVSLLNQRSVQEELKLSEDQVKKISELTTTQRGSFRNRQNQSREELQKMLEERNKTNQKALAEILKPDQLKRAKQISWQQQHAQAFSDPEVVAALQLRDAQKEKIKTIHDDTRQEAGQLFQRGGGGNQEELRKKREALNKATDDKVISLLTADQMAKWKDLTGETFKGEITQQGGRRRGGAPPQ